VARLVWMKPESLLSVRRRRRRRRRRGKMQVYAVTSHDLHLAEMLRICWADTEEMSCCVRLNLLWSLLSTSQWKLTV